MFRAVLIERKRVSRANNPLAPMLQALADGSSLIIFPEGTRGVENAGEFKSGLYHLARAQPSLEFIPVFIENLNRVLPKGEVLPSPILCSVRFGTPMFLQEGEDKLTFINRARSAMLQLAPLL